MGSEKEEDTPSSGPQERILARRVCPLTHFPYRQVYDLFLHVGKDRDWRWKEDEDQGRDDKIHIR